MYIGGRGFSGVNLCSRQLCCEPQMAVSLANSRASRLCVHPFDPLSAPCRSHEWIGKVLCFPRNLVVPELHDAHGVSDGLPSYVRMNSVIQRSSPPMIRRTANRFLLD